MRITIMILPLLILPFRKRISLILRMQSCIKRSGKEHKKYEFGDKISIIRSVTGIVLGVMSFRNEYDGHIIESSLDQVERLSGRKIKVLAGDRGYRGKKEINGTKIMIPDIPKKSDSRYQKLKKHKLFCKCAGITNNRLLKVRLPIGPQLL